MQSFNVSMLKIGQKRYCRILFVIPAEYTQNTRCDIAQDNSTTATAGPFGHASKHTLFRGHLDSSNMERWVCQRRSVDSSRCRCRAYSDCPQCCRWGSLSIRQHSRYQRKIGDVPQFACSAVSLYLHSCPFVTSS